MKNQPTAILARFFRATCLGGCVLLLSILSSHAGAPNPTWKTNPGSGDWNTASNWTPATVPNGSFVTAMFATSSTAGVSLSANTQVDGIIFSSGASAFTITLRALPSPSNELQFDGAGITNNSGLTQNFVSAGDAGSGSPGLIVFNNNSSAGTQTAFTCNGPTAAAGGGGGEVIFSGASSAPNSTFTNNGAAIASNALGAVTKWNSTGSPGTSTFINNGGSVSGALGGVTKWSSVASPGNSTCINNGATVSGAFGGETDFSGGALATATLIANSGAGGGSGGLIFIPSPCSGKPRVEIFGNGTLQTSGNGGVTIGSLEGSGLVTMIQSSSAILGVGSNNRTTTFSGVISNIGGGTGALTKVGRGKLSLSNANTYAGGTTLTAGSLLAKNKTGSATGSGPVQVNGGTLGGTGKITGAVTLGTGSGSGAFLAPGASATKPGTLAVVRNTLTFNSDSTYNCALDRSTLKATKVAAKGVTINGGAQFAFADLSTGTLTPGTVFTVINNTAAMAHIAGTFSNLANNATFTSNGTTFKASYTGGTGNDLTLTVQ